VVWAVAAALDIGGHGWFSVFQWYFIMTAQSVATTFTFCVWIIVSLGKPSPHSTEHVMIYVINSTHEFLCDLGMYLLMFFFNREDNSDYFSRHRTDDPLTSPIQIQVFIVWTCLMVMVLMIPLIKFYGFARGVERFFSPLFE
jgi:hypothetical protein